MNTENKKNSHGLIAASVGTVSHATLRLSDLIVAFGSCLESLRMLNCNVLDNPIWHKHNQRFEDVIWNAYELLNDDESDIIEGREEDAVWAIDELDNCLQIFAPDNAWFGAHEGDCSHFGFWELDEVEFAFDS